ncbi:exonuclease subunit SbcD [Rhizobium gallicum]|uniref:metallophosphoesterase family protein n=1 Tax=Rhizobium gallicum TaxID=56730 RepID=UPI0030B8A2D7
MRLLHTADLHLGRQFHGMSLEDDHAAILDQILQAINTHRPDVFIIAGDIFDRASPPATSVRQFNAFLGRVARETEAAVVMIAGNHDSGDRIGAMSVLTDVRRALIRGPLLADETPLILHDAAGPVAISALPYGYEFAARDCFGDEFDRNARTCHSRPGHRGAAASSGRSALGRGCPRLCRGRQFQ